MSGAPANLAVARRLVRTFRSAPDPRRQARQIYACLAHTDGWPPTDKARIEAFGRWLETLPPEGELQSTCAVLVNGLGAV